MNAIHARDNAALKAERDELALLTVPSDADAQVAVRLRIAEDALEEISKLADHCIPPYAYGDNEAACDFVRRLDSISAIVFRSAKGEANG